MSFRIGYKLIQSGTYRLPDKTDDIRKSLAPLKKKNFHFLDMFTFNRHFTGRYVETLYPLRGRIDKQEQLR